MRLACLTTALTAGLTAGLTLAALAGPAAAQQSIDEQVEVCATCHGEDGDPVQPDYPIIWGQHFYYLYIQLKDFKSGLRQHEVMQGIVADLDKDTLKALAQYFSEKPKTRTSQPIPDFDDHLAQNAVISGQCVACHLGSFEGNSRVPALAGQNPAYLEHTMLAMKHRERNNAPDIGALLRDFEDPQLKALASFLASQ